MAAIAAEDAEAPAPLMPQGQPPLEQMRQAMLPPCTERPASLLLPAYRLRRNVCEMRSFHRQKCSAFGTPLCAPAARVGRAAAIAQRAAPPEVSIPGASGFRAFWADR